MKYQENPPEIALITAIIFILATLHLSPASVLL